MVWPWIERLDIVEAKKNFKLDKSKFPRLLAYIEAMKTIPAVKQTLISKQNHLYFMNELLAKREPNYDLAI